MALPSTVEELAAALDPAATQLFTARLLAALALHTDWGADQLGDLADLLYDVELPDGIRLPDYDFASDEEVADAESFWKSLT